MGAGNAPKRGAQGALLMAPGLATGLLGIAVASRSGAAIVLWEPPFTWVEDPYFFWGVLSFCMPRILSSRPEMKAWTGGRM